MIGLDKAKIIVETEMKPDMVISSILRDFNSTFEESFVKSPKNRVEALERFNRTIKIDHKWINSFRITKYNRKTSIIIEFNYPRFFEESNFYPITDELKKILVDETIIKILGEITGEKYGVSDLNYFYIELSNQFYVGSFFKMNNIINFMFKTLVKNFKSLERKTFGDYSRRMEKFYNTGFAFRISQGVDFSVYAKTIENNKKQEEKKYGGAIRGELKLTKNALEEHFETTNVGDLSLVRLGLLFEKFTIEHFKERIINELYLDLKYLESKLSGFESRELSSLVRDYQERALDSKIMELAVTNVSTAQHRQTIRYREKIKVALKETQDRSSPLRDNFGNLKRLEEFCKKILLFSLEIRLTYTKGLIIN